MSLKTKETEQDDMILCYADVLSDSYDFLHEETALQSLGKDLSTAEVHRTQKCHPKTASKGIEYTWGHAKQYYPSSPLKSKKVREISKH